MTYNDYKKHEKKTNPLYKLKKEYDDLHKRIIHVPKEAEDSIKQVRKEFEDAREQLRTSFNENISQMAEMYLQKEIDILKQYAKND